MNIYSKEKFNTSLVTSKSQSDLIIRRRIQSANFTKMIKNRIFKGYNKIKITNSKDFNLKLFLSKNPEEKYLPSSEKYNIYYEKKFLSKLKTDYKHMTLLLKNSITNKKKKSYKNKSVSFSSKFDIESSNFLTTQRVRRAHLYDMDSNNSNFNINNSREIFKNKREEKVFSKYPFVFFDRLPDNINNPNNLMNYPYYNLKYKQKNRDQQYFLFTISHQKEKSKKNLYRCFSARTIHKNHIKNERNNNSFKNSDKYDLISFSCATKKENSFNLKKLINSIKKAKLKRFLKKKKTKNY